MQNGIWPVYQTELLHMICLTSKIK